MMWLILNSPPPEVPELSRLTWVLYGCSQASQCTTQCFCSQSLPWGKYNANFKAPHVGKYTKKHWPKEDWNSLQAHPIVDWCNRNHQAMVFLPWLFFVEMLLTRKEIAQQAEHQAKDSDKWRELESVTCPSTRVILFILSNLSKQTRTSPKTLYLQAFLAGSQPEDRGQEGRARRHDLLLQPARGRVRDEDRRADDSVTGADHHVHEVASRVWIVRVVRGWRGARDDDWSRGGWGRRGSKRGHDVEEEQRVADVEKQTADKAPNSVGFGRGDWCFYVLCVTNALIYPANDASAV